jgi:N-acetylneuraminic acid mutarotase/ElaB/YqjD/DUF883 family membrane-anchored ribosome-binding protein
MDPKIPDSSSKDSKKLGMWQKWEIGSMPPTPRNCVAATSCGSKFYVFGGIGQSEKEKFNELWSFDVEDQDKKWVKLETHGDIPSARYCTTINCFEDKLVVFGGFDGDRLNTVHFLNLRTLEWKFVVTTGEIPEKRSHHTAALIGNRLIVFGGLSQEGRRLNDLHVLDLKTMTWSQPQISGQPPSPRLGHVSAILQLSRTVLAIFGGYGGPDGHTKFNDLYLLHFDTMTWTRPIVMGTTPPGMYAHQAIAIRDKLLVFGGDFGVHHRNLSNDIYIFELGNMKWTKVKATGDLPPPRSHFCAAAVNGILVVFGGSGKGEKEKLNDVYALDLDSIDILKEVSFEETKAQVLCTIDSVSNDLSRLLKEMKQEKPNSNNSEKERTQYKEVLSSVKKRVQNTMNKMKRQFEKLVEEKDTFDSWREEQIALLEYEKQQFELQKKVVTEIIQSQAGRVRVNVGGTIFDTSLSTLTKDKHSMLSAMFSGRYGIIPEKDGSYFIDRDGTHFRYILNYLRDNGVTLPRDLMLHYELLREANFYQLSGLVEVLERNIKQLEQEYQQEYKLEARRHQFHTKQIPFIPKVERYL